MSNPVVRPPLVVRHARLAGLVLLVVPIPFAVTNARASRLVVPGDAAATASQIAANEATYRLGIVSTLLLMIATTVVAVVVFYQLFKVVDPNLAGLMIILNLIAVPITMVNELNRFAVLHLLSTQDSPDLESVSMLLNLYTLGSMIAGLLWGVWLVPYALLIFKSGFLPKLLGALVIIECCAFVIYGIAGFVVSDPTSLARLPDYVTWVELLLPLWLLIKGIDVERWQQHAAGRSPVPVS